MSIERIFRSWGGLASHVIGDYFDYAKPFIDNDYSGIDPLVRFVAAQLFIDCHLSSESVLLLIQEQKEWDADLIARAVMEGSLKFTYMLDGSAEEVKSKVNEYWELLPKFYAIKHSERARRLLDEVPNSDRVEWQPFRDLIIDEAEVLGTRASYSRQDRQAIEERWSFTGICKTFAKSDHSGLRLLVHLAHGYGMSSHLLHKDADGIGMVWERSRRAPERQTVVRMGHAARVVSDICAFAQLRLFSLLRACQQPTLAAREIQERYAVLFTDLTTANQTFSSIEYGERT